MIADQFINLLPFGVQNDNGGIGLDFVFGGQGLIGLLLLRALLLLSREIQLDQHQVLLGIVSKLGRREDLALQFHARRTPVGTGEIHKNQLLFRLRFGLRFGKIGHPV